MQLSRIVLAIEILFCFLFFVNSNFTLYAQVLTINNRQRIATENRPKTTRKQERIIIQLPPPPPKIIEVEKKITGLRITTQQNANVTLELITPIKGARKSYKATADDNGTADFDNILSGTYKITAELEGFQQKETKTTVQPKKITAINVPLEQLKYDFSITTNVQDGVIQFARAKQEGNNSDGTPLLKPDGAYCVVPIEKNKATISQLKEGYYALDISAPNAPEYKPEYRYIKIPDDIPDENPDKPNEKTTFNVNLENTESTTTFSSLIENAWSLPEGWRIDNEILKASGVGVALPKSAAFLHYKDFEMQSTVRLVNNTSIGFVVRAIDKNNYYLIQLTGDNTKEQKYRVSAFIVKDGKPTTQIADISLTYIKNIKQIFSNHDWFEVHIKANGNKFDVLLIVNGIEYPLGNFEFKDDDFRIGAIGLASIGNSSFDVGRFIVNCIGICKTN